MFYKKISLENYFSLLGNQKMLKFLKNIKTDMIESKDFSHILSKQEMRTMEAGVVGYIPKIG